MSKIYVRFGAELWGKKSEKGYEYEIFYPMEQYGTDEVKNVSYKEALAFMIEGTHLTEEDVKEYLLF